MGFPHYLSSLIALVLVLGGISWLLMSTSGWLAVIFSIAFLLVLIGMLSMAIAATRP